MAMLLWALPLSAVAIVLVRRRSAAIVLLAVQSLLLAAAGVEHADGTHEIAVAAAVLAVRAVALPALLVYALRRTRERHRLRETAPLARVVVAFAVAICAAALMPDFGLEGDGREQAVAALVALGICIAALRRALLFQVVGFLIAENGIYLAGLSVPGGVPGAIELALLFDLVAVAGVAVVFGARIHAHFGTTDTGRLRALRD